MESIKEKFQRIRAYMNKTYMGIPYWAWYSGTALIIIVLLFAFGVFKKGSKKSKSW